MDGQEINKWCLEEFFLDHSLAKQAQASEDITEPINLPELEEKRPMLCFWMLDLPTTEIDDQVPVWVDDGYTEKANDTDENYQLLNGRFS